MSKKWIALCLALLLVPAWGMAAQATGPQTAEAYLEAAMNSTDRLEQLDLVLQAVEIGSTSAQTLVTTAQMLYSLDLEEEYTELCESLMEKAMNVAYDSDRAGVLQIWAELLITEGKVDEAIGLAETYAKDEPENEQMKMALATVLFYAAETDRALEVIEGLIEDSPRNLDARILRGTILLNDCRWDDALLAYQQIEAEWPEYLEGVYGQFLTYIGSGEFEMGVRALDLLLGSGAEDAMWLERARIRLWRQYMPDKALTEADALLRMNPGWIDAYSVKLVALMYLDRYEEAYEVVTEVAAVDPDHAELLRGIVQMNESKWTEAIATFEALLAKAPGAYLVLKNISAAKLDGLNDVVGAEDAMRQAFVVTEGGHDSELMMQLGHLYRYQGKYEEAARAFTEASLLVWDDPSPFYYLTMVCIDAGRTDEMEKAFAEMQRRYPGWYETLLTEVFVQDVRGDSQASLDAVLAIEEKFSFPAESLGSLKAIAMTLLEDPEGVALAKEALDDEDGATAMDWDMLAYIQLLSGDLDAAEESLVEAERLLGEMEEGPDNGRLIHDTHISILTTRADLLIAQGDMDGAALVYQEAIDLGMSPSSLLMNAAIDEMRASDAFADLVPDEVPEQEPWDLTVLPLIPQ